MQSPELKDGRNVALQFIMWRNPDLVYILQKKIIKLFIIQYRLICTINLLSTFIAVHLKTEVLYDCN